MDLHTEILRRLTLIRVQMAEIESLLQAPVDPVENPITTATRNWLRENPFIHEMRSGEINSRVSDALGFMGGVPAGLLKRALTDLGYRYERRSGGSYYLPPTNRAPGR